MYNKEINNIHKNEETKQLSNNSKDGYSYTKQQMTNK